MMRLSIMRIACGVTSSLSSSSTTLSSCGEIATPASAARACSSASGSAVVSRLPGTPAGAELLE